MKVLWGEDATYYTQRNNIHVPGRACGVTSVVNTLAALGYDMPKGKGQPEDRLYEFIAADPECLAMFSTKPKKSTAPINEWQDILALGANRWMNKCIFAFNEFANEQGIMTHIMKGGAAIVTGEFPAPEGKTLHHTVALIGVEWEGDPLGANITKWWMRDSWGDHTTLYRTIDGKLVALQPKEFAQLLKTVNVDKKWCIYVNKRS